LPKISWVAGKVRVHVGALKDFFERVYHPCVERITTGLRWRRVLPPVTVVGATAPSDLERAEELGATLAAGMAAGIF
jgi:hypothetical protein